MDNGFHGFFIAPENGHRGFEVLDKDADDLLYWYVTKVLGRGHRYGWWELEIDL